MRLRMAHLDRDLKADKNQTLQQNLKHEYRCPQGTACASGNR